jgi:4,5-DOPA dioxygenase extradiol
MNALGGTPFSQGLASWGARLPTPRALLVVSAHWESRGVAVTAATQPETIHDFGGFPEALYTLQYPAPGAPDVAREVALVLAAGGITARLDQRRGLDHGAWSPLLFLRPKADVPVVQLSLDRERTLLELVDVGRALRPLRDRGVLILGSGNVVHNLGTADLENRDAPAEAWSREFDAWARDRLLAWDLPALALPESGPHGRAAHPTREHYAPIMVVAGAADPRPVVGFPWEGFEHATLSMRCVQLD